MVTQFVVCHQKWNLGAGDRRSCAAGDQHGRCFYESGRRLGTRETYLLLSRSFMKPPLTSDIAWKIFVES